jgi:hypothetical protein
VEDSLVYSVVKESHFWLLESNPFLDDIFVFQVNPTELLTPLKCFLPDYLIDLDGGRKVRRFKNRLKVLDFTIKTKKRSDQWLERAFETCRLFDVHDDGKGADFIASLPDPQLLPSEFHNAYLVLALDSAAKTYSVSEEMIINLVAMIEKPVVVTGGVTDRSLADRISQSTGCAVFPTCGDLTMSQIGALLSKAKGAIVFDSIWSRIVTCLRIEKLVIADNVELSNLRDIAMRARSFF